MSKKLILTLSLMMLLLIGCSSPQDAPTDVAAEMPVETDNTAVQDHPLPTASPNNTIIFHHHNYQSW